jgi:hypothetical protein
VHFALNPAMVILAKVLSGYEMVKEVHVLDVFVV